MRSVSSLIFPVLGLLPGRLVAHMGGQGAFVVESVALGPGVPKFHVQVSPLCFGSRRHFRPSLSEPAFPSDLWPALSLWPTDNSPVRSSRRCRSGRCCTLLVSI